MLQNAQQETQLSLNMMNAFGLQSLGITRESSEQGGREGGRRFAHFSP